MQLILVKIKWHIKWNYLIQKFHDIFLSYYFKLLVSFHSTTSSILNNFEIQWDRYIVWLSLASRRLYNILSFLWLYNEFFIILYNILKIAELDCCQIITLSIYVPSTHAYTHVLRLSLDLPYEKR